MTEWVDESMHTEVNEMAGINVIETEEGREEDVPSDLSGLYIVAKESAKKVNQPTTKELQLKIIQMLKISALWERKNEKMKQ